jgi:phosphatidylserine/phosphatidylglycerophosphate/cardiolipin synthase-like enzyme
LLTTRRSPFAAEWSGGKGINIHHKFVVTDFNLPTAKVYTGSSNLSVTAETKNGDNLVMIEDCRVATGYAIEALRVFRPSAFPYGDEGRAGSRRRGRAKRFHRSRCASRR